MTPCNLMLDGMWRLIHLGSGQEYPMPIPGDIHAALHAAGAIDDPYFADNEHRVQWVGQADWAISRDFELSAAQLQAPHLYLDLSRVDTFAEVSLNDQPVLGTSNMFSRYQPDVRALLREGTNTLTLRFQPAQSVAAERAKAHPFPLPYVCANDDIIGHLNMIRKAQCHGGWDWGISLMTAGIYAPPVLRSAALARLDFLQHEQNHRDGQVTVTLVADLTAYRAGNETLTFCIGEQRQQVSVALVPGEQQVSCTFVIDTPQLWWPAGYGEQPLYEVSTTLGDGQHIAQRIGLRTLEVDNRADALGKQLTFRVNGQAIFCKGANWIPSDAMPSRQTRAKHARLLGDAKAANMNMIRIWGGGQYEYDHFYELCDELGLLVWQDAMFACSQYPSDDAFLAEVEAELRYQVRRLSHHASLALWCGDNEIIGSLQHGWYQEVKQDPDKYLVNYDRLNQFVQRTISQLDPSRTFWPSSPCNGPMVFGGWDDDTSGDMHFWDVWHAGKSFDAYHSVRPRFCSEFGFQSFSSLPEVKTCVPDSDWNVTAPAMEHHQKNARGNSIITEMFTRLFRMPVTFENQLYLSQVQQAMAMDIGIEFWRTTRPVCMGTLYWQLNDNWPVASWSSIEYSGRWKQMHYHVRRAYNPVMVTAHIKDDQLQIWGVNDRSEGVPLSIQGGLYDLDGECLMNLAQETPLAGESARQLISLDSADWQAHQRTGFLLLRYQAQTADGLVSGEKQLFLTEPKRMNLPKPQISARVEAQPDGKIGIHLSTDKPAFYVTLEVDSDSGTYSDNSLSLLPGETVTVTFTPRDDIGAEEFAGQLRVYDLASATM